MRKHMSLFGISDTESRTWCHRYCPDEEVAHDIEYVECEECLEAVEKAGRVADERLRVLEWQR